MEKFNEGICMAVDYSILESWNIDTSRLLVSIRYRTKVRGSSERKRLIFLVPPSPLGRDPFRDELFSKQRIKIFFRLLIASFEISCCSQCTRSDRSMRDQNHSVSRSEVSTERSVCSRWPARDRGGRRCIPHSPNSSVQWAVSWIRNDTRLLPAWKKKKIPGDFRSVSNDS